MSMLSSNCKSVYYVEYPDSESLWYFWILILIDIQLCITLNSWKYALICKYVTSSSMDLSFKPKDAGCRARPSGRINTQSPIRLWDVYKQQKSSEITFDILGFKHRFIFDPTYKPQCNCNLLWWPPFSTQNLTANSSWKLLQECKATERRENWSSVIELNKHTCAVASYFTAN